MLDIIAVLCLPAALGILAALSAIDLRERLLPDELVLGLTALGIVFHMVTLYAFVGFFESLAGATLGFGLLWAIRAAANFWYDEDALGLGDVKLMGAGGIWLGTEYILIAMTIGAFAGFIHGLAVALYTINKTRVPMDLTQFAIPAGPGFAFGLVIAAIVKFHDLPYFLFS